MQIRAVCTDIDGTLLNKDRVLSARTIDTIRSLKDRIPIILASSRMPSAMWHLQVELGIEDYPMICFNGGYVVEYGNGISVPGMLDSFPIPLAIAKAVLGEARSRQLHVSLYSGNEWYAAAEDKWTAREALITKVSPTIRQLDKVLQLWDNAGIGIHKIMCMGDAEAMDNLYKALHERFLNDIHLYRSKSTYLEIAPKPISKSIALRKLMRESFNCSLEEVIAFGDNYNDIDMIRDVGIGIAVGNAIEEVKAVAKEITLPGKEDGVAIALEKYFSK